MMPHRNLTITWAEVACGLLVAHHWFICATESLRKYDVTASSLAFVQRHSALERATTPH